MTTVEPARERTTVAVRKLATSPTSGFNARVKQLIADGRDIIQLSAGEAGGIPPVHVREAAAEAAAATTGHGYGPIPGLPTLRAQIAADASTRCGLPVRPEQVVVTNGAKQAVFLACLSMLQPGEQALVPVPAWPTYLHSPVLAGGQAVPVPTGPEDGYLVTVDQLAAHATAGSRLLILSSPVNPTGEVYDTDRLHAIGQWCGRNGVVVVLDEIYRQLRFVPETEPPLSVLQAAGASVVIVDGVSKSWSMAGWRVGWLIAPVEVAKAATALLSHTTNHVGRVPQVAALAALQGDQSELTTLVDRLTDNRNAVLRMFRETPVGTLRPPAGSFYAFPSFDSLIGASRPFASSVDLAEDLLTHAGVAVVPGSSFGADQHVRLSFSGDRSQLDTGVTRLLRHLSARQ